MYLKSMDTFFKLIFGHDEQSPEPFKETLLIPARNEVGECVFMEVPKPIRSDLHPKLTSRVGRNLTFLRYDIGRGQT
jgi:hypothetical protein